MRAQAPTTYTDKTITRILAQGTAREKATLYLRDKAAALPDSPTDYILKQGQQAELIASVGSAQKKEFDEFVSWGTSIENALMYVYSLLTDTETQMAELMKLYEQRRRVADDCDNENIRRIAERDKAGRGTWMPSERTDFPADVKVAINAIGKQMTGIRANTREQERLFYVKTTAIELFEKMGLPRPPIVPEYGAILDTYRERLSKTLNNVPDACKGPNYTHPAIWAALWNEDSSEHQFDFKEEEEWIYESYKIMPQ